MSSSNISRNTIRTAASGTSQLSTANLARHAQQQAGLPESGGQSYGNHGYVPPQYADPAPVTNTIHASQRQHVSSSQGPPVSYQPGQSRGSRRPSVSGRSDAPSSYGPPVAYHPEQSRVSRRPSVSGGSVAPSRYGPPVSYHPEESRMSRRPSVSGESRAPSEYGPPVAYQPGSFVSSRRPSMSGGSRAPSGYGPPVVYHPPASVSSRRPSISGPSQTAHTEYGPSQVSHHSRSNSVAPRDYPRDSRVSRAPSVSHQSNRSHAPSSTRRALDLRSEVSSSTIRPSDSASNVSTVRDFPPSRVGSRAPSHTGSRAPSHTGSRVPSRAPTYRDDDTSTIIMPSRTQISRSNSVRPSDSNALGPRNTAGFPDMQAMAGALPGGGEGGRVRFTKITETTRVTESVEIGVGSSSGGLRRQPNFGDSHGSIVIEMRPRRLSFESESDDGFDDHFPGLFGEFRGHRF